MNQLACRRQDQRRRRKLGNLHGTAILTLNVNRRNQAPIGRELEAPGDPPASACPTATQYGDTCSQKTVAERADFSSARAT